MAIVKAYIHTLIFFCLFTIEAFANGSLLIELKNHLGKEELAAHSLALDSKPAKLGILVNSTSGDLNTSLELARQIYALKVQNNTKVYVYIENSALGPSAIFPFLADSLEMSYNVSWGDILFGSEGDLPPNLLANRVKSFILPNQSFSQKLMVLAQGMSDREVDLHSNEILPLYKEGKNAPIVVNQNQLIDWKIAQAVPKEEFLKQFPEEKTLESTVKVPLERDLESHIHFNQKGVNKIGHLYIGDQASMISQATWIYVKNALDYYKANKPAFIILELNTPGGEVYSAQKISDALKEMDTQYGVPCVAYINNWALSAGAMLAYSCRFIAVVKDGSMGAAEPVLMGAEGKMEEAPEKINSALRVDFANRARFYNRNPDIAEAMVDKDIILVWRYGKVVRLNKEEEIRLKGQDPDVVISAKGKLLTLGANDLMKYGVANFLLPPQKLSPIIPEEKASGQWPASKELLFQEPFFKAIPNAVVDSWQMDWKTRLFTYLAHPMVASILFLGMMLGFYIEINTPGFGVAGSIGLICLFLIVLSSFALDIANILELVLLIAGICFVLLDLFLIPTFGMLGIVGVVMALGGLFALMLPGIGSLDFDFDTKTFNAAGEVFLERLGYLSATFVIGLIVIGFLARFVMPTFSPFKRFILSGKEQEGYISGQSSAELPKVGKRGKVLSTLRPTGKVVIDDQIFDALSRGSFIEKDEKIEVVELDGSVIVVDKVE